MPHRHSPLGSSRSPGASSPNLSALQRALLVLSLLVSLAVNPVGAFVHAWEHLHDHNGDPAKALHHGGQVCELCAAYAAIGHAVPASGLFLVKAPPERPDEAERSGGIYLPPAFFPYRQRAPPRSLRAA